MRVPNDAAPSVQQALREIWGKLDRLTGADIDLHGRRVVNASQGVSGSDYVTRSQAREQTGDTNVTIQQTTSGGGVGAHQMLSTAHTDSLPAGASRGDIIAVNSTGLWARLAKGASGTVLTSDGTDVSYATHSVLSATHGDALAGTVLRGDIIVGNATPKWSRLAKGSAGHILISDGTDVAYGTSLATLTFTTSTVVSGGNGSTWTCGSSAESITVDAATKDSTANLLPANSIIEAVVIRVTTAMTVDAATTAWTLGDATDPVRFATSVAGAATTTAVAIEHWDPTSATASGGPQQMAAAKVRISHGAVGTTYAGVVRVIVYWRTFVAPTS